MTISTTTISKSYSGDGSTHSFAYDFPIFAEGDLTVIIRSSAGTETVKTKDTHYIVTGAGVSSGGTVLFKFNTGNASDAHYSTSDFRPASGETVVIRSELANTQTMDLVANDPFPAETLETNMDKLVRMVQQHEEELDRSLKLSRTNTMTSTEFTTSATDRASKLIAFDTSGELSIAQELGTLKGNWAASTAYVVRDLVKDTSTNNIFICVTAHTSSGSQPLTTNTDSAKWSLIVDAASATTSQNAAAASATAAASSETDAQTAQAASETARDASVTAKNSSETALATFQGQYHGAASSDPSSNLDTGDLYFKTDGTGMKVYNGSAWIDVKPTSSEQTNIDAVASANSNITALAASAVIADMALLGTDTVIADMAQLANSTIIDDLAILADSTITDDMAILATNANVTAMGHLGTNANVTAMGHIGTSANVTAMGNLGTTTNVTNMANLNASGVITNIANLNASGVVSNIGTVAGISSNVTTVANNVSGVNSFADRYRIASSAPTASLDVGDLYFDTTANELKVYKSSGWATAGSTVNGTSARFTYNISGTPTSVTGADANGNTLAYDAGFIDCFLNGVKQVNGSDVTVTSGDTVTFASALANGDVVDIVGFGTFNVAAISASNISSGTVPVARLGSSGTRDNTTFLRGDNTFAVVDTTNASNLSTGTLPNARLTSVPNSALANSAITINGSAISLGGSVTVETDFTWETKTSAFNVASSRGYFVDTSGGAVTATLPASPTAGDTVRFIDLSATFDSNNLTVARNGKKVQGDASDMTVATERAGFALVFSGDTQGWLLMEK